MTTINTFIPIDNLNMTGIKKNFSINFKSKNGKYTTSSLAYLQDENGNDIDMTKYANDVNTPSQYPSNQYNCFFTIYYNTSRKESYYLKSFYKDSNNNTVTSNLLRVCYGETLISGPYDAPGSSNKISRVSFPYGHGSSNQTKYIYYTIKCADLTNINFSIKSTNTILSSNDFNVNDGTPTTVGMTVSDGVTTSSINGNCGALLQNSSNTFKIGINKNNRSYSRNYKMHVVFSVITDTNIQEIDTDMVDVYFD